MTMNHTVDCAASIALYMKQLGVNALEQSVPRNTGSLQQTCLVPSAKLCLQLLKGRLNALLTGSATSGSDQQYTCLLHGRQQARVTLSGQWQQQQQAASCTQQGYLLQEVDQISAFLLYVTLVILQVPLSAGSVASNTGGIVTAKWFDDDR